MAILPTAFEANYQASLNYWDRAPATIEGMMEHAVAQNENDLQHSAKIIKMFKEMLPAMDSVLDCAAGIGRVSKTVLVPLFNNVDL